MYIHGLLRQSYTDKDTSEKYRLFFFAGEFGWYCEVEPNGRPTVIERYYLVQT